MIALRVIYIRLYSSHNCTRYVRSSYAPHFQLILKENIMNRWMNRRKPNIYRERVPSMRSRISRPLQTKMWQNWKSHLIAQTRLVNETKSKKLIEPKYSYQNKRYQDKGKKAKQWDNTNKLSDLDSCEKTIRMGFDSVELKALLQWLQKKSP